MMLAFSTVLVLAGFPRFSSSANQPLQSLSEIRNLTNGPPRCTHSPAWTSDAFDPRDCTEALDQFLAVNVSHYSGRDFEFLAPGAAAIHAIRTMQTPLKVSSGSCTMVIAMLRSFPTGTLPGVGPQVYYPTDVASYGAIYFAALGLTIGCTRNRHLPGWSPTGGRNSIGAFFWATASDQNKHINEDLYTSRYS